MAAVRGHIPVTFVCAAHGHTNTQAVITIMCKWREALHEYKPSLSEAATLRLHRVTMS